MNLLGVNLREISLKRNDIEGELKVKNVKNNINIIGVKLKDVPVADGKALILTFEYSSDYELEGDKSLGNIHFLGDVAMTDSKKKMDSVVKTWKSDKKVEEEFLFPVLQAALDTVNVEAIYLSRKVLLPSPVRLPQISPKKE